MLKFLHKVPHLRRKKCLSPLIKNKSFRSIFQIVVSFVKLFQDEEITRYKRRLEKGLQCTTLLKTNLLLNFFSKILLVLGDRNNQRITAVEYNIVCVHTKTILRKFCIRSPRNSRVIYV